ncbi:hypothetical protein N7481_003480 [Penicillium waksmanii]|uniref:uncharacterized protein n=1 Tax=Penicillium waksmanii TaxID=69791 RepID=UPI002548C0ED|nr:uncharacterized protein N7481_003480 [Penicillium waksmanii]KAJ5988270.1 hypothetical protein N7481_003480 [Penicillium waksmanii]
MDETLYTESELRLVTERHRKYQGTAKINISQIVPHPSVSHHLNATNVRRLCEVFDKEGCRRLDVYNHVSAVVSSQHLHDALRSAQVSAAEMMTDQPNRYPHLHFNSDQVKCLHGQHRLKAGEEHLSPIDQWWTVNLYLDDISPGLQTTIIEEYSNEKVPTDGEIYRKVRQYRYEANAHFENRWLARLSENKARRLRGLESHPTVRAAFDSLLVLPSLVVHGMQIGSFPQALAICCDEEIVHALNRLLQFWSSLLGNDRIKMLKVDPHTVETLQLLAPGVSSRDRTTVKGLVHSGGIIDLETIEEDGRNHTVSTYIFKNLWYLESCANCMKRLITPNKSFPTIRSAMRAAFLPFDPDSARCCIQISESEFREYARPQADHAELGYRQLWLYAMRHYPRLSKKQQKKGHIAKPQRETVDDMILYDMAVLAKRLGFQSPEIEQLIQQSPDRQIARDALLKARRPDRYRYDEGEVETLISKVIDCFLRATTLDHQPPMKYTGGREVKKESRQGHPQAREQLQDRQFLFIDQIHDGFTPDLQKATSFFVRRNVYFTFFSDLRIPDMDREMGDAPPDPDLPTSPLFVPRDHSPPDLGTAPIDTSSHHDASPDRERQKEIRRERRQEKRDRKLQKQQKREYQLARSENHPRSNPGNLSTSRSASEMELTRNDTMEVGESEQRLEIMTNSEAGLAARSGSSADESEIIPRGLAMPDEPEQGSHIELGRMLSVEEESRIDIDNAELDTESQQLQVIEEESTSGRVSPHDDHMEEPADAQNGEAVETTESPWPMGENESTLRMLEGREAPDEAQGPSRSMSRKSHIRESQRRKPYDRTQRRRQRAPELLSSTPQDALEQEINTLLQPTHMGVQVPTARPLTTIDFLEEHRRPQARADVELSRPEVTEARDALTGADKTTENPGSIDQEREYHVAVGSGAEPSRQSSGIVPVGDSPQVHGGVQQEPVAEATPHISPRASVEAAEAPSQPETTPHADEGRTGYQVEEQGGIQGREEAAESDSEALDKASKVTIIFRARDKNGEWNHMVHQMVVDRSDPSPVERMAAKNARERHATYYDKNLRQVAPALCFNAAVEDGTNTVFMTLGDDLVHSEETMDSITRALQDDSDRDRAAKRRQ